jgi:tRNA threonylcarbamoyladenosine biosynthesis protein TsaE
MSDRHEYLLESPEATVALGAALAAALPARAVVYLHGDLGAGKTTLVRGLLRAAGHAGAVRSPTYTLLESYAPAGGHYHHFDLYRLGDPEELEYLGLRDLLAEDGVLLFEWPQRGEGWLPAADLHLHLAYEGERRQARLEAASPAGAAALARLAY